MKEKGNFKAKGTEQEDMRVNGNKAAGLEMSCHTTFPKKKPVEHESHRKHAETPILVVLHDFPRCPTTFQGETHGERRR